MGGDRRRHQWQQRAGEKTCRESKACESKARESKTREDKAREDKARESKAGENKAREAQIAVVDAVGPLPSWERAAHKLQRTLMGEGTRTRPAPDPCLLLKCRAASPQGERAHHQRPVYSNGGKFNARSTSAVARLKSKLR